MKIIIEKAMNDVSEIEDAINARLEKLGAGWRIVSASTAAEVASTWKTDGKMAGGNMVLEGAPKQIVFVTTVIVERVE